VSSWDGGPGLLSALSQSSLSRFAFVGLVVTALHLAMFSLLSQVTVAELANVVAFVLATQVNFAVSYYWTWSSRRLPGQEKVRAIVHRALVFNGTAALGFGLNAAVFSMAYRVVGVPSLASALIATVGSAAASFVLSSRLVFRRPPVPDDADVVPVLPPTLAAPLSEPMGTGAANTSEG